MDDKLEANPLMTNLYWTRKREERSIKPIMNGNMKRPMAMNKMLAASILGVTASVSVSYGNGAILFDNYQSSSYEPVIYGVGVAGHSAGSNVDDPNVELQLFYAIGTFSSTGSFLAVATAGETTFIDPGLNASGYYGNGPGGYYDDPIAQTIIGWTGQVGGVYTIGSNPVTFMVEGWGTGAMYGGDTYGTSSLKAQSSLWTEVAGNLEDGLGGIAPAVSPAFNFSNGPPLLAFVVIPEPATLTLVGLGAAGLLALRRLKA